MADNPTSVVNDGVGIEHAEYVKTSQEAASVPTINLPSNSLLYTPVLDAYTAPAVEPINLSYKLKHTTQEALTGRRLIDQRHKLEANGFISKFNRFVTNTPA